MLDMPHILYHALLQPECHRVVKCPLDITGSLRRLGDLVQPVVGQDSSGRPGSAVKDQATARICSTNRPSARRCGQPRELIQLNECLRDFSFFPSPCPAQHLWHPAMRAPVRCVGVVAAFWSATNGLIIDTPSPFLLAGGPARITFTKQRDDPVGAFFNLMEPNKGRRLADNVDLSLGFVDVIIDAPAGTYDIAVSSNETDGPRTLATSEDFLVVDASQLPSVPAPSATTSALSSSIDTPSTASAPPSSAPNSSPTAASPSSNSSPLRVGATSAGDAVSSSSDTSSVTASKATPTLSPGAIAAIVLSILGLVAVLILLFCFLRRRTPAYSTLPSDSASSGSLSGTTAAAVRARERQNRINTEMRLLRKKMDDLRRTGRMHTTNNASSSPASYYPSPTSTTLSSSFPSSGPGASLTGASDLERSRQLNDQLQNRIVQLEAQLQSAWAMGLSDEPPPGYAAKWIPQTFTYPDFPASPLSPSEIKPPMYRPFRWGEYHVTMGIRSMHWAEWIELDDQFEAYYHIRKHRLATNPQDLLMVLPPSTRKHEDEDGEVRIDGGAAGAIELVRELSEYLSRRYPTTFNITRYSGNDLDLDQYPSGWDALPPIQTVRITTGGIDDEFALPLPLPLASSPPLSEEQLLSAGREALRIASLLVQDDLAIMVEGTNGGYYFQAGAILVAGFWRMIDKIGKRLDEIHLSGDVPQYADKLHVSLARFFRRLPVDKPVARNNYFIQVCPPSPAPAPDPEQLAWGEYVLGPEEDYGGVKAKVNNAPLVTPESLRMRTERQTLRRLPRTGVIVFTIRTYLVPVKDIASEPGVAARFASAVRSWGADIKEYKGEKRYGEDLLRYLDEMAAKDASDNGEARSIASKPYPL
ncbi:hypothetical protein MKEN_00863500 [Mycena kentingensis (nom. inval.)]|nr:hypothetical protein MKEN_00863500 [Mycena kentingensis (nom. inval.)]